MQARELLNKNLLRATEVAEFLDISRAMAYRLMQRGDIRTVRISGSRRVRVEEERLSCSHYSRRVEVENLVVVKAY